MPRILVVDDSEQNLAMIEVYLASAQFDVVAVGNGRDAVERCLREEFDLILLDVVMPGIDGFEVCRRLKADPKTAFLPVIFLTGRLGDESDRVQAYEMGAVDYIQKPVHREELVARIRVMLRLSDARARLERENATLQERCSDARRALADAEHRLRAFEDLRRDGDDAARTGLLLLDDRLQVLAVDAMARQLLAEPVPGKPLASAGMTAARVHRLLADGARAAEVPSGDGGRLQLHVHELHPDGTLAVRLVDVTARRRLEQQLADREASRPPAPAVATAAYAMSGFVGRNHRIAELAAKVDRLRQTRATVLIRGESGTGKEILARALHFDGPGRHLPFLPIHCGALSPSLVESELFGYEKGAFTGAQHSRDGLFSVADGGTVFLDEIGEMPMDLQVKLLRVLQMGEIRPVGANHPRLVDVRILAATNRDPAAMVRAGTFREDLYYRLEVVTLSVPALREHLDDIPLLVEHFLARGNRRHRRERNPVRTISQGAMARLLAYPWPGNVRELENMIDRAFALGVGNVLQEEDLPPHVLAGVPPIAGGVGGAGGAGGNAAAPVGDLRAARARVEREAILQALATAAGDRLAAARLLGLPRSTFYRRLKELGL